MCTYKTVCVTNRRLANRPFMEQLAYAVEQKPDAVILREKDLSEPEYIALAREAAQLCAGTDTRLVLHSFWRAAAELHVDALHMPLDAFLQVPDSVKAYFTLRGVSVHSAEEAVLAEKNGATHLIAGHIFATDCKRGVPPRGLSFLHEVCAAVRLPVYAIGGISRENCAGCIDAGAAGVCMMSGFMRG